MLHKPNEVESDDTEQIHSYTAQIAEMWQLRTGKMYLAYR
jgi:hypothetical protein